MADIIAKSAAPAANHGTPDTEDDLVQFVLSLTPDMTDSVTWKTREREARLRDIGEAWQFMQDMRGGGALAVER